MRYLFVLLLFLRTEAHAAILHVGPGQPFSSLTAAVNAVQPGDTILIHSGTYPGGQYFANLQGNAGQWISIRNAPGETVVFEGGTNAIQLTDPAFLHISGLIFQHQTGNGVNIDDGGTYGTPAHDLILEACTFRDMSATGNNDLLKLSGLDYFEVRNCSFQNGAAGGSGIDMVGCHHGVIESNLFEHMGSNSIQCKGGSEWVRIHGNFFRDGGQRTLNLGGSTGLQFFRPDTAHFEAGNLQVYANIIVGSWAAVAYVGAVNVAVVNNTIYQPENWVFRILQETVDPDRFLPCGNNSFVNNIVWIGDNLSTTVNIGPNTAPETFFFAANLWYNEDNANWPGPILPAPQAAPLLNVDPLFADPANDDFSIPPNSPAAGAGVPVAAVGHDFLGQQYALPPSVGAIEANPVSATNTQTAENAWQVFPNPVTSEVYIIWPPPATAPVHVAVFNGSGRVVLEREFKGSGGPVKVDLSTLPAGMYFLSAGRVGQIRSWKIVKR